MVKYFIGCFLIIGLCVSCKKETETYYSEPLSDYFPLQVGKYITYDLDSTVFLNFGTLDSVIQYQAQDRVDALITDNLGRPTYRIFRFIRTDSTQPWVPNNTFMATPTATTIEYVENNLRYIKLSLPIASGFSWPGNSFIDTYSQYSDVPYLDGWTYVYDSIGVPLTYNSLTYDSTLNVSECNQFLGQSPSLQSTQYAEYTYSAEKYAKGIGLIYRYFIHWEYQSVNNDSYTGYGITLSIIDHN